MLIQLLQKKCYLVIRLATNQNFSVYNMDIFSFIAHRNMCNTYKVTQGNGVSISALNDYFFDSNGELYPAIYNQADDRKVICFDDNYYGQMYEQMSLF